jgi:hypothetical protein
MEDIAQRINRFLLERTEGEKYAPVLCRARGRSSRAISMPATARRSRCAAARWTACRDRCRWVCWRALYPVAEIQLEPGDKIVIFSDGLSEAGDAVPTSSACGE